MMPSSSEASASWHPGSRAHGGVEILTVYAFSTENWKRPKEEIDYLMALFKDHMKQAGTVEYCKVRADWIAQAVHPFGCWEILHSRPELKRGLIS